MDHFGGAHRVPQDLGIAIERDLDDFPRKSPFRLGRMRKEYLERLVDPCARARRACDQQRLLTARQELCIKQQERQGAEMVTVQMRQHDSVDTIGVELTRLECDQRGRTAIEQQSGLRSLDEQTGIESAAGAERIARSDDGHAHAHADALGRAETSACHRLRFCSSSGTGSFAGFMKSTEMRPVMSATVNVSPATYRRSFSSRSSRVMNSRMRGLLASAQAGTCGTSISFMAGCELRKTWETGNRKCSSSRRFHISMRAISSAPRPNSAGSGCSASK